MDNQSISKEDKVFLLIFFCSMGFGITYFIFISFLEGLVSCIIIIIVFLVYYFFLRTRIKQELPSARQLIGGIIFFAFLGIFALLFITSDPMNLGYFLICWDLVVYFSLILLKMRKEKEIAYKTL